VDTGNPAIPEVIVLYTADPHESAMPVLRILGPARQAGLRVLFGNQGPEIDPGKVAGADVVVIQRDFPRFTEEYATIVTLAQDRDIPVVYETDDQLLSLPQEHISQKDLSDVLLPVLWAIIDADLVTTSTPFLRDQLAPFNPNVQVLPNLLDEQIWSFRDLTQARTPGDPLRIGYMGGQSHLPDLIWALPALEAIRANYQGGVQFKFWGVHPPEEFLQHPEVEWVPLDIQDYTEFARYFSRQDCDIFISPLIDNSFNRAKSAIKFLEYSAMGVPGVYSDIPAYADVISDGQNGFLASGLEDWQTSLSHLIENPELHHQIGAAAQKTVRESWLLSQQADRWPQVYTLAAQAAKTSHPKRIERIRAVTEAARLIRTRHHELVAKNQQLNNEVQASTELAENLQARLDEIYQSRSWQLLQKSHRLRHRLVPPDSQREYILKKLGILS